MSLAEKIQKAKDNISQAKSVLSKPFKLTNGSF
jgi:hypothetical protein